MQCFVYTQVDVSFGLAAVTLDRNTPEQDGHGPGTTTIMGCRCIDDVADGMKIQCALVPYERPASSEGDFLLAEQDLVFNVAFQTRTTAKYLTCKMAEVSIQSVRWPSRRFVQPYQTDSNTEGMGCESRYVWFIFKKI